MTIPEPTELLQLIVEVSIALAGFAGIVVAISHKGASSLPPIQRLNLINLLATSFAALFLSLLTLVTISAEIPINQVWVICSSLGLAIILYFTLRSTRIVLSSSGNSRAAIRVLLLINVPLACVCLVQVWNIFSLQTFWPTFLMTSSLFAIGCYSFVRLLFSNDA